MKKIAIVTLIAAILLSTGSALAGKDIVTVTCEPPKGFRLDYINGNATRNEDAMSGSYPVFIWKRSKRDTLTVLFPASKMTESLVGKQLGKGATEAVVVKATKYEIVAIEMMGREVWQYSLFLKDKVALLSRIGTNLIGSPTSGIFYTKCEVN